jgi:ATP-dependent Lhr-like helicase
MIRRRSLARLRREVEPVDQAALGRFSVAWQGVAKKRRGPDALLDVIEQLQGAPLPASILETEILPARLEQYEPADLDAVIAAGEVVWVGLEPLGDRDGRIALFLADHLSRLMAPAADPASGGGRATGDTMPLSDREQQVLDYLGTRGASFFAPLHEAVGGGYPAETVDALWNLVWRGLLTNDTMHALRAFTRARTTSRRRTREGPAFRSRRLAPPSAEGRWALVRPLPDEGQPARGTVAAKSKARRETTSLAAATAQQLLTRYGIVTRESVTAESLPGGFGVVYAVLKAMEEAGRIRRGYFVAGLGATQFAMPGALDLLRSLRDPDETLEVVMLAATDPANPYGATLKWPTFATLNHSVATVGKPLGMPNHSVAKVGRSLAVSDSRQIGTEVQGHYRGGHRGETDGTAASRGKTAAQSDNAVVKGARGPTRTVGATVVLVDGALAAYLARGDRQLLAWIPDDEPRRSRVARAVAAALLERARSGGDTPRGMLLEEIDGVPAALHPLAPVFVEAGFISGAMGLQMTKRN